MANGFEPDHLVHLADDASEHAKVYVAKQPDDPPYLYRDDQA
ncbi:MAG TPA: hypothetical protein VFM52_09440 [Rhodanobacter sp.]|nr:hypothetical protein [Rhodanobacter sp.]